MKTLTKELQDKLDPKGALELLKKGNLRFIENTRVNRDLKEQASQTSKGQYPFATVLSCIDSRVSSELIFDQGIGDIFSIRIAGNIINDDIIGSMEFATKVAGTKLILVLGHTKCGAVNGACDNVELGKLTGLLEKIKPAISQETLESVRNSSNLKFVEKVTTNNVKNSVDNILELSPVIKELVVNGQVAIVGGIHDISTGEVTFLEETFHFA